MYERKKVFHDFSATFNFLWPQILRVISYIRRVECTW